MNHVELVIDGVTYSLPPPPFDGESHTLAVPRGSDQDEIYRLVAEGNRWVMQELTK